MKCKLLLNLFLLSFVVLSAAAQKKHALIFAIGDYPEAGGWGKISSAQDVGYIKNTLLKQNFSEADIKIVADAQATKEGIENALKNLIASVAKNDVVVIHFSSHGEQVADDNGDEADGYDEAIVSYNAALYSKESEKEAYARGSLSRESFEKLQANYFRDDEFGKYIQQLRAALGKGGDVVVFMDNCHSGTGTRGSAKVRGGKGALTYAGYQPKVTNSKDEEVFQEKTATRGNDSELATYVVVSAALASELNYETTGDDNVGMGSLTYAVSKVFENLKSGTTYRTLFAKIQAIMNEKVPGQHPVLEGNGLDRMLFGGAYVDQKPYVEVEKINNPLEINAKSGTFAGLNVGAKVSVYPAGTTDPSKAVALAKGVVIKASNYKSTIKLDKATKATQPSLLYVFVTEPVFNVKPIVVGFAAKTRGSAAYSTAETDKITAVLKKIPLVSLVGNPDLLIEKGATGDVIKVASNGYVFSESENIADTTVLKATIGRYAQYQFLQKLEVKDSTMNVQVKLVPVINGKADQKFANAKYDGRVYEYKDGDTVMLWVHNPGKKAVYVNILDMQPNGVINTFLPNAAQSIYPADLIIQPGETKTFPNYEIVIGKPYGIEVFKIFVTAKEINLEGLATPPSERAGTRGSINLGPFEKLVDQSSTTSTRGAKVVTVKESDGSTYNMLFRIVEK